MQLNKIERTEFQVPAAWSATFPLSRTLTWPFKIKNLNLLSINIWTQGRSYHDSTLSLWGQRIQANQSLLWTSSQALSTTSSITSPVLICPTFVYNKTYFRFAKRDPRVFVIPCKQHMVEHSLKIVRLCVFVEGTNTLIILDDCAASKYVQGRTGQLVDLGFSPRQIGISVRVLTQQIISITKPFLENVAEIEGYLWRLCRRDDSR